MRRAVQSPNAVVLGLARPFHNRGLLLARSSSLADARNHTRPAQEGMDVVRSIEEVGSQVGKTSQPVVIADCGELKI